MMGQNDNAGEDMVYDPLRATWVFEVARPGFWGFMRMQGGMVKPLCTRDLNNAPPGSNEVYSPPRKHSHLSVVK